MSVTGEVRGKIGNGVGDKRRDFAEEGEVRGKIGDSVGDRRSERKDRQWCR